MNDMKVMNVPMAITLTDWLVQHREQVPLALHSTSHPIPSSSSASGLPPASSTTATSPSACHDLTIAVEMHQVLTQGKRPGDFLLGPCHQMLDWSATCHINAPTTLPTNSSGKPGGCPPPCRPEALPAGGIQRLSS